MAFFNDLGKKASEATAKAVLKAQELSETTRLNSLISEEERKIDSSYYQIGKLYVSIHGHDVEEALSGMVENIFESQQKIDVYRTQIQDLKGLQRCEKCGAEVERGVAFCTCCGTPMPKIENIILDDHVKCSNCGTIVKRGMRFCTACGKPMILPEDKPIPNAENNEIDELITEKICSNCGAKYSNDIDFCTECGTKL